MPCTLTSSAGPLDMGRILPWAECTIPLKERDVAAHLSAELLNPSLRCIKLLARILPSGVLTPPVGCVGDWDTLALCPCHQVSHPGGSLQLGLGVPSGSPVGLLSQDGL